MALAISLRLATVKAYMITQIIKAKISMIAQITALMTLAAIWVSVFTGKEKER